MILFLLRLVILHILLKTLGLKGQEILVIEPAIELLIVVLMIA